MKGTVLLAILSARLTRNSVASVLTVLLFAIGGANTFGQASSAVSLAKSALARIQAHTNAHAQPASRTGTPQLGGPPFPGYLFQTPASLACIYGLQQQPHSTGCNPNVVSLNPPGGSRAIAIVDAFDDPNAFDDLYNFSAQFGVTVPTSNTFQVVYAPAGSAVTPTFCGTGAATEPPNAATQDNWAIEESIDIEYSHAMAPSATLYLVEAQSNSFLDLFCAVSVANSLVAANGGGEVSMSWAGGEFPEETILDSFFTQPGVVYFAGAGDSAGVVYPAASPNVVSVGGTSLSMSLSSGKFEFENTWQDAGGGPSAVEPRPSYQNGIVKIVGTQRGTPDVAAVANLNTGVWVLDTLTSPPGWYFAGGTSLSTPILAGIVNAAGSFEPSSAAELQKMYKSPFAFAPITYGNCGFYADYFATATYNFCTGLGSPNGYAGK